MEPLLRASLATLAALSILGGAAAVLRREPRAGALPPERKLERVGLLLHHGVALGVAVAAALGALLGGGDGRPLALCAAGPLLVLCLQEAVPARLALFSVPLVVLGLVAQALVLVEVLPAVLVGPTAAGLAAGACAAGSVACALKRRSVVAPRARALLASQAVALAVASAGGLLGVLPVELSGGMWAVALGAAGALGTAGRLNHASPPGMRELVAGLIVIALVAVAGAALPLPLPQTALAGVWAALVSVSAFALVRATVDSPRGALPPSKDALRDTAMPSAAALGAMSPLLDDALLHRPARPRVIARVPARRLLDAALERARQAQPSAKTRDLMRVDVHASDNDIDVDGDPADLAEALCAVLDNALRVRGRNPEAKVQVHLRGSPASVTFEVSDSLPPGTSPAVDAGIPDANAPFLHPRPDPDRPGLGVALARARVLVERNGGQLLTRSSGEGSTVQVTMPRRMHKGSVGQA